MQDVWAEYVGTANVALLDYIAGLRPCYRLGVLAAASSARASASEAGPRLRAAL